MAEEDADVQRIRELIKIMRENDLVEIDIKHGDDQLSLRRAQPAPATPFSGPIIAPLPAGLPQPPVAESRTTPTPSPAASPVEENSLEIKSPIVGTFYEAPSPDSDPFVEIGAHIDPQSVVGIIEAMKVMNEIRAEISGTLLERRVSNGQAVEYGQVLFRVRPD